MQFSVVAAMSLQNGRSSGRSSISARSPVSVSCDPVARGCAAARSRRTSGWPGFAERFEAVQAEVVAAALHVGRGERDAERFAEDRQILEEDLFLQVLGAGRDEHALAAEDRRHEIGERLAGPGAGLGEQHAAAGEHRRDGARPSRSAPARASKPSSARASGPSGAERRDRRVAQLRDSGYSGNFRHRASTFSRTAAATASSSGDARTRAMNSAMRSISGSRMPRLVMAGRADADAARDHRRILIERNRVLVDGDAGLAERRLGDLAGEPFREDVDEHQVIVGAAADEPEARGRQRLRRAAARWRRSASGTRRSAGSIASLKHTALAAMMCISGPPWTPGNTERSRSFAYCARQRTMPPRGPRSVLCVVVVTKSECGTGLG